MKTAVVTRPRYRNTGIETFESQVCPWLIDNFVETEKVEHSVRTWYPFSITLEKLTYGLRLKSKLEGYDKVFVPAQERVLFNPDDIEAEVIPYIHDIMPVTCMYKSYSNDSISARLSGYLSTFMATRYMKFIANCRKVVTGSEKVKEELEKRTAFSGELETIYQGVEDKRCDPDLDRDIDLVYVGDLKLERKNPELVKKAFQKAEDEGFTTAYINFENNEDLPASKKFIDVSDDTVGRVLRRSKFYMHGSKMEGFGRGPVEAQMNGCIPLALDNEINKEILGPKDVSWRSVESAQDVVSVLNRFDNSPESMKQKARENAESFSWKQTRQGIAEVLELV